MVGVGEAGFFLGKEEGEDGYQKSDDCHQAQDEIEGGFLVDVGGEKDDCRCYGYYEPNGYVDKHA